MLLGFGGDDVVHGEEGVDDVLDVGSLNDELIGGQGFNDCMGRSIGSSGVCDGEDPALLPLSGNREWSAAACSNITTTSVNCSMVCP